jgi:ferredoxin
MPKKYHIEVKEAQSRRPAIGKSGIVDWGEGCLRCAVCVKQECVYGVYKKRAFSTEIMSDTIDELCKNCMRCVQGCPGRLIHKVTNPEWELLGDEVYSPEIITANWKQAATGKIPVSGSGYGGPFSGPGFDSMWTDMSEIVRPTRDGIHGREYISTVVDIGGLPARLEFDENGDIKTERAPFLRMPAPMIFDALPFGDMSERVWKAITLAATRLGLAMVVREEDLAHVSDSKTEIIPLVKDLDSAKKLATGHRMIEIMDHEAAAEDVKTIKEDFPQLILAVRTQASPDSPERCFELAQAGVEVIHLAASEMGYIGDKLEGPHLKDMIRSVHGRLLEESLRDRVTFIGSGGIAMAEHVIKACLCGANLVAIDIPILLALECRVCRNCVNDATCPVEISSIDTEWGAQRIGNLMGAWHNQLLEMMGAMGIREARRLRGEQGRLLFYEDLEAETFGNLFT